MYKLIFLFYYVISCCEDSNCSPSVAESWIIFVKELRATLQKCLIPSVGVNNLTSTDCVKEGTLKIFDEIMSSNIIPLLDGACLIRFYINTRTSKGKYFSMEKNRRVDVWHFINDSPEQHPQSWSEHIFNKIRKTLTTHVLQIDINNMLSKKDSPRHRRRHQMLPVMVFGVTALGMVLVPIGFQFLAVLGGKALLLAKMALLLASINGLKRIATSGLHYGLYHAPDQFSYGYFDRGDSPPHPRVSKRII